jgi:hypothetical protein
MATVFISVVSGRVPTAGRREPAEMNTAWPDFQPGMPARPSVVVLSRRDGGGGQLIRRSNCQRSRHHLTQPPLTGFTAPAAFLTAT